MIRTFYEMKHFTKKWLALGFTDDDLSELQQMLLDDVFAKNEKDNLTKAERNTVRRVVEEIRKERIRQLRG